jgi:tetratricopeptide (TPR) repeat protein
LKSTHYDQATVSYNAGDYPQALKGYYRCLKEDWDGFGAGDAGLLYHRIGNCLIKMRNLKEAVVSYQKALQDDGYPEKTSIQVNLGTTFNGIGAHEDAITCFNKALADATYATPYRAHMGLGNAYTKLGQHVEAGMAFRDAALDGGNPNPVKALTGLASTFMVLGRPDDAVEAYRAVLDFPVADDTRRTLLECLARAYVAAGRHQEGLDAFEGALAMGGAALTREGLEDYLKARTAVGPASEEASAPPAPAEAADPFAGLDLSVQSPSGPSVPVSIGSEGAYGQGVGTIPHPGDTGFFTLSDADLIATGKRQMRKERKLRHTGLWAFLVILVLLVAVLGAGVAAYTQGVGIPSQEKVITDFFAAHAGTEPVEGYWIDTAAEDRSTFTRLLDGVARTSDVRILSIDSKAMASQALVDAKLAEGGMLHYRIDLVRDVLGWKISGIEMVFASTL